VLLLLLLLLELLLLRLVGARLFLCRTMPEKLNAAAGLQTDRRSARSLTSLPACVRAL